MNSIDIIIVNYKSTDLLIQCLESVFANRSGFQVNVYVQDNGSDDDVDRVQTLFPDVKLTKNHRNLGFSAAVNNAIALGSSPCIVLLNPDSTVNDRFFEDIVEYLEDNADVAVVGPKIFNQDSSVQGSARSFPTLLTGFFGRTSLLTKWFPNNWITRRSILTTKINGLNPVDVDWVSGACMVVRRRAVEQVGLMDEQFFMYWEDVDWCRRMWGKGWRVVYFPKAGIVHHVGGSSDRRPFFSMFDFHKSCYLYFVKYSRQFSNLLKPVVFLGLFFRFLFVLLLFYYRRSTGSKPRETSKILFLITEDWYFWSHRLSLARAAREAGLDVVIATRVTHHKKRIESEGFGLIPLRLERKNRNLAKEIRDFLEIVRIYRKERPSIVHHVALKPVLYGSLAARMTGVPAVVNAIAGLGFIFVSRGRRSELRRKIVEIAYRFAFSHKNTIGIFQNAEDLNLFTASKIVRPEDTVLIRGSGVDTSFFSHQPEQNGIPLVVLASRMLWDKGVGEFVDAARRINQDGLKGRFVLVGDPDPENPMTIPDGILNEWHVDGVVEWWGHRDDIPNIFAQANIVVLPSYREGLPKVLLEAASCGRAIVTTDVPGCREVVHNNFNGLLVPPHDSAALSDALLALIHDPQLRAAMGARGRAVVEAEFAEHIVVKKTMGIYEKLV